MILRRRLGLLIALSLFLSAPVLSAVKRYAPPAPEQIEKELLELINRDRELRDLKPLAFHPFLGEMARGHSAKMSAEGELSHHFPGWPTPEQKLCAGELYFLACAENIARSPTPVARFIHEALMGSPLHRINILDGRMLQAGVGVCKRGSDYFVSEEFAAIIDCPVAEKTMVFLENEICRWCREEFGMALDISFSSRVLARVSAQQYLANNPIDPGRFSDRKMLGINMCHNDIGPILVQLKKEIDALAVDALGRRAGSPAHRNEKSRFTHKGMGMTEIQGRIGSGGIRSLAVGVVWGRNVSFPGGAYAVSLLLFE